MVKRSEFRKRKYEDSLHPERIGAKFEALKPVMLDLESQYFPQIELVERKVKSLVEAAGVASYEVAQYVNVGRQCYSINKNFTQATRDAEAQRVVNHWAERGLDPTLLRQACVAGGCDPADPPLPPMIQDLEDKLDELLNHPPRSEVFIWNSGAGTCLAGQTRYPYYPRSRWAAAFSAAEAIAGNACLITRAGTLRNLVVGANVAPGAGQSFTYTVRVNGVNTVLTVTLSGAQITGLNITNTVPVSVGDYVTISVVNSAAGAATQHVVFIEFEG